MPIKFIKIRTFKTKLLALKLIHSYIKMTCSIWRHVADEKLVSILRKEYGYIVEEGYLLGQSELISNKQKMNNCLIIMQNIGNYLYSHEYLLNIQLVWSLAYIYVCLVRFGTDKMILSLVYHIYIQITHSWDLFLNLFSPILQFIFSKFCLFCFLLDFFEACSKESIDGTADWFDSSPYFWSSKKIR